MFNHPQLKNHRTIVGMDCIFSSHCYQQWLRIKNCLPKHKYFVNIKSDLTSIFLVKQHNTQKWPKNSYIFLILEPTGRFVHCKKCSPSNMANKMSLNSYLDHHLCLIFQIWLHNNASWQKGHLIVHLAKGLYPGFRFYGRNPPQYLSKGGLVPLKRGNSIQMLYTYILPNKGGSAPTLSKIWGQVVNFGGIPHPSL